MLHAIAALLAAVCLLLQPQPDIKPAAPALPQDKPVRQRDRDDPSLARKTWTIQGVERMALVHVPGAAAKQPTPVVFAFHGHGGNARNASLMFRIHTLWPEAIVVYMEGLPTPGALTDPDGQKNGWQNREGIQDDRDLKFFDAVLASLRTDYKVEDARIYALGHSNGGGFTYLLWRTRPDVFAAFAPSGAFTQAATLKPKPVMHIAGKTDNLVKFPMQERTTVALRLLDGCAATGETWAPDCTLYPSKSGTPVITMFYDGGHHYPHEAPELIVKFLKSQSKPPAEAKPEPTKPATTPG